MYRRKTTVGLFLLTGAVLLTGCADRDRAGKETGSGKETEIREDLVPLAAVGETFDAEADKLKGREFDNLNFADAYFSFTEADEVYSYAYEDEVADLAYSPDEAYDYLCGWMSFFRACIMRNKKPMRFGSLMRNRGKAMRIF